MKKEDVRELREVTLEGEYIIPEGYFLLKEPTKIANSSGEVFKIVIGRNKRSKAK